MEEIKSIKLAAPAKINLTLEVLNQREDGYHNIKSIMQAISLYDYLTITIKDAQENLIKLSGNSTQIPYDNKNLVYKAAEKFINKANIKNKEIEIYIEKNIPIEAGLAGGSTDAAATFYGLNKLFNSPLQEEDLENLCASLGSDLNFCLHGGTSICLGRGEQTEKIKTTSNYVTLIKPIGYGISAKEAYQKFALSKKPEIKNYTEKLAESFDTKFLYNSLELALLTDYKELAQIKELLPEALMSGSGPTFFILEKFCPIELDNSKFLVIEDLQFIPDGIKIVK